MKILHILPTVDPKSGGPAQGVRQHAVRTDSWGLHIEVLTLDSPDAPFLNDYPLPVHALGPAHSGYRYSPLFRDWLRAHARDYDAVIVNGLWQYHSFGTWRALRGSGVPYFVFCHGMLDPWFKKTYPLKHLKKWLYWPWAEYRVLRDARAVFFTCEEERLLARQSFWLYRVNEVVVNYGASEPPPDGERLRSVFLDAHPALRDKRVLLFLGRIQEKKGCDLLIEAFARVASARSDSDLHLVMAGPDQTGWVAELQQQAAKRGVADRITWPGTLQGDMKWGAFFAAEAFVLPSHQENFGIAVAEALGCGLPVLISDKVNIWREIEGDGAGFVAPDTVAGTENLLRRWLAQDAPARERMAGQAQRTFTQRFTADAMAHSLFEHLQQQQQLQMLGKRSTQVATPAGAKG